MISDEDLEVYERDLEHLQAGPYAPSKELLPELRRLRAERAVFCELADVATTVVRAVTATDGPTVEVDPEQLVHLVTSNLQRVLDRLPETS